MLSLPIELMAPTVGNFTIWFCSHLFLRSVDMAARDFLEQNGLNDLIKLVVEENKVQCYGYNCFSFYDQFKRWTIKIRHTRLSTLVFGSTLPFYSTELVEKNGTTFTWIQKPIFTCVKPNAYITNALIDYFYPTGVCRFLPMASLPTHTACFDLLDQNGWKSGEICVPLASRSRNVHIHLQLFYTSGVIYDFYPPWLHLRGKQPLHFHN